MKTTRGFMGWATVAVALLALAHRAHAAFPLAFVQAAQAAEGGGKQTTPDAGPGDEGKTGPRDIVVERGDVTVVGGHVGAVIARLFRDIVVERGDVTVGRDDTARDVVVVFGNVRVEGNVRGSAVSVFGNVQVKGMVHGDAVAVVGRVTLEDGAEVKGDVVGLMGGVMRGGGAKVGGKVVNLGRDAIPGWLWERGRLFVEECVMLGRPLSMKVDFVWWVWGGFLVFHALLAAAFPAAVRAIGETLRERPLGSAMMGLAGIPLGLLLGATLGATVVLAPVVVLLIPVAVVSIAIGDAAFMRVLGAAMLRWVRATPFPAAVEFMLGAALVTGLFLVPFVGIIAWTAIDMWVFGAVLLSVTRRESRGARDGAAGGRKSGAGAEWVTAAGGEGDAPGNTTAPSVPSVAAAGSMPSWGEASVRPVDEQVSAQVPRPRRWHDADTGPLMDAAALEGAARPGLGRRLGALVIDWVPLLVIAGNVPDGWDGTFRVGGGIAYYATMVAWRGTTLGGLVAGLRVVRTDGRAMDKATSVVRALAAILSVLSGGLGWMWASWDARRQSWHDRIAGTVVVRDDSGRGLL